MRPESRVLDCSKSTINWENYNNVKICRHNVIMSIFYIVVFLLSSLVNGPSLMPMSSIVPELCQFLFIKDLKNPEIGNISV